MGKFFNWIFGTPEQRYQHHRLNLETNIRGPHEQPTKPEYIPQWSPDAPLFLAHRENGIGIVETAEIAYGKATGRRYIKLIVDFGAGDLVMCHLNRVAYTHAVIKRGLPQDADSEEANVAAFKGASVKVRWEHHVSIDGKTYVGANIVQVL